MPRHARAQAVIPGGPLVSLVYRVEPGRRQGLFSFLSKAIPFYERHGDLKVGIFESLREPGLLLELVAYASQAAYVEDQARVEHDREMKAVLGEWHSHFDGDLVVDCLAPLDLPPATASLAAEDNTSSQITMVGGIAELSFQEAVFNDFHIIENLLQEAQLPLPDENDVPVRFLLARAGGAVVACLGFESYGFRALLRSLAVCKELRRRGIGRVLVKECLRLLARQGFSEAYLLSSTAVSFALALGFSERERESLPAQIKACPQLTGNCCQSATCLGIDLI